jgi:alpha-mannosidase
MTRITNPLPQLAPYRAGRALQRLEALIWEQFQHLSLEIGPVRDHFATIAKAKTDAYVPFADHSRFACGDQQWGQVWFRIALPAPAPGETGRRWLHWDGDGEMNLYFTDESGHDQLWSGLDFQHKKTRLPDAGGTLHISCGLWHNWQRSFHHLEFRTAQIALRNHEAWAAYWDLACLGDVLRVLYKRDLNLDLGPGTAVGFQDRLERVSPLLRLLLRGIDQAIDAFDEQGLAALRLKLSELYQRLPAEAWQPGAAAVGHAHIDLVWLWPEKVVQQKGIHSFANQLRLIEAYPEYIFSHSSPALYRAAEQLEPAQMSQIKARIAEGRWEATGALEVELDNQLPCGESIVRSLVYGQRKFTELRGTPSTVCWLPDVFGYSACLPQILALGEVPYFYTTKMTWSTVTKFPYLSFVWRGSDGTEVLTHLCSASYNCQADAATLDRAVADHRQCDVHPEILLPHGNGDGGGGATEEILERARRFKNLSGVPKMAWTSAETFFERMAPLRAQLPVYQGELYLEYHRGTYTTQSEFKRLHRATERALQTLEAVRVLRALGPLEEAAWLRHLFCAFHDALPGSSIALVYAQLQPEMAENERQLLARAQQELSGAGSPTDPTAPGLRAFNPLAFERTAVLPVATADGTRQWRYAEMPGLGYGELQADAPRHAVREASPQALDNGLLRAAFDAHGQLAELTVAGTRLELAAPAHFSLYYDEAHMFDAWDIDHYVLKHPHAAAAELTLEVVENSPLRAMLRGSAAIGQASTLTVHYILEADSPWLRIEVDVDWHESHQLLKFHAPTAYQGKHARFGNPFGSILRPQLPGVQADEAMWEVPGSRWAAVTHDNGQGLALVTEAKYGFSCKDGDLGVSLLRSTNDPDPTADQGRHQIRFAIGAHRAETTPGMLCTAAAAEALFSAPLLVHAGQPLPASPFALETLGSLVPSWVLPGEQGGLIIRLHETSGSAGTATLRLMKTPESVELVNFLEKPLGTLAPAADGSYAIPYRPYQILSVRMH